MNPDDAVSRSEFELLFDFKANMGGGSGPRETALRRKSRQGNRDDNLTILKYLSESMTKEGITPARLFKMADKNFN